MWSLIGGIFIGLAATLLLLFNGRIAGISGILSGVMFPAKGDTFWRVAFIAGLLGGGLLAPLVFQRPFVFEMLICSGRTPIVCALYLSASLPSRKFIFGEPMNPATNLLHGLSYNSMGLPTCSITPA